MFVRRGGGGNEEELLYVFGDLAKRWGFAQGIGKIEQLKRTDESNHPVCCTTGGNLVYGNRLCAEVTIEGHPSGKDRHVFKFSRELVWRRGQDRIQVEIAYAPHSSDFNCEDESAHTNHGMAHAED